MHFEVEQKYPIVDAAALECQLRALGVRDGKVMKQIDQYFNHPARDFAKTDEALRLRQIGDANFMTYKGPKLDATTKTRTELELPLPSGATIAASFAELLTALGFHHVAEVLKLRRTFHLLWQQREIELAIDQVENLGTFLEIELAATESDLIDAKTCLASLAEKLHLSNSERRSYLELLVEKACILD